MINRKGDEGMRQNIFHGYWEWDGKRYTICAIRNKWSAAEKVADGLRKKGWLARVLQYAPGVDKWGVYKRKAG